MLGVFQKSQNNKEEDVDFSEQKMIMSFINLWLEVKSVFQADRINIQRLMWTCGHWIPAASDVFSIAVLSQMFGIWGNDRKICLWTMTISIVISTSSDAWLQHEWSPTIFYSLKWSRHFDKEYQHSIEKTTGFSIHCRLSGYVYGASCTHCSVPKTASSHS